MDEIELPSGAVVIVRGRLTAEDKAKLAAMLGIERATPTWKAVVDPETGEEVGVELRMAGSGGA